MGALERLKRFAAEKKILGDMVSRKGLPDSGQFHDDLAKLIAVAEAAKAHIALHPVVGWTRLSETLSALDKDVTP